MPARIALQQCLQPKSFDGAACLQKVLAFTTVRKASSAAQKRYRHDPYALAQAQAKKAANKSRQAKLQEEREKGLGDAIRGITTPFIRSFETATAPTQTVPEGPTQPETSHVNFLLTQQKFDFALERAKWFHNPTITTPFRYQETEAEAAQASIAEADQPISEEKMAAIKQASAQLDNAEEAVRRIAALNLGNGKDRQRANTQRIIEVFGRHNTDKSLPRFPLASVSGAANPANPTRAGPDTGSSEVQIAILTAKIKTLADFVQTRGKKDHHNKRNLRLLVHRRQKLLQYLRRKERGGPRWQHVTSTLGLTEGTWKGEITIPR